MQAEGPVSAAHLAGIVKFGSVARSAARRWPGSTCRPPSGCSQGGQLDEIAVAAKTGVVRAELVQADPGDPAARHAGADGAAQAQKDAEDTNEFISFLQDFLLAFGGIALFVGSFVIANSLSITIAQRMREFATLRTLGASRRQVLGSVILEALVVGAVASVIGLFLGLGLAKGLFSLFDAVGFTLPNSGLMLSDAHGRRLARGRILVTLLASLRPALRATRVPPIAAVREGATLPGPLHALPPRPRRARARSDSRRSSSASSGAVWGRRRCWS